MKPSTKAKLGAGALAVATLFGATACPTPTDPPKQGPIIPTPITKTHTITFKGGDLKFDVNYKALPTETALPAWLAYLEERLGAIVNGDTGTAMGATAYLMSKGNRFTIDVEYTGNNSGISWNAVTQSFKVYNDWISTATNSDLSASMIRDAFNSVEIAAVRSNAREAVRLAKTPADVVAQWWQLPKIIVYHYT